MGALSCSLETLKLDLLFSTGDGPKKKLVTSLSMQAYRKDTVLGPN